MPLLSKRMGDVMVVYAQDDADLGYKDHIFRQKMEEVIQGEEHQIVVNLSSLDYLNSGAIAALIWAKKRTRLQGGDLVLAQVLPPLRGLFELMRLDLVFDIFDTEEEAIGHFVEEK